jgi:hypothetical protein
MKYLNINLKKDWSYPKIPKGYSQAVVKIGQSGNVKLDFITTPGANVRVFTSDDNKEVDKSIWPWIKDYKPSIEDWESIGFLTTKLMDSCFGQKDEKYMFKDWIDKL